MKELQQIVEASEQVDFARQKAVLATVVEVHGSAYRRPGARMLVTDDGRITGAISGGCLEGDALRKALLVMDRQEPMLVTYDTTDEEDDGLGVSLGCSGIIHILMEPVIPSNPNNPIALFKALLQKRQEAVLVTIYSLQNRKATDSGTRLLLLEDNQVHASNLCLELSTSLLQLSQNAFEQKASNSEDIAWDKSSLKAFVDFIKPPISLVIVGAGNDARPLMQMANVLGWSVTVVDGRNNYATKIRFPEAGKIIVTKPEGLIPQLTLDQRTAVVLMTHNYIYDIGVLRQLASITFFYTGVLGPRKKLERMLADLEKENIIFSKEQLDRLHGPVGLDLGAEGPEEIALSIISEIQQVFVGSSGAPLRQKNGSIHGKQQQALESGVSETPVACAAFQDVPLSNHLQK